MSTASWKNLKIFFTDLVVWVLAMIVYVVLRFFKSRSNVFQNSENQLDFDFLMELGIQAGLILGGIYGLVDILLNQTWLRKRSFGSVLLIKGAIHFCVIIAISILVNVEALARLEIELTRDTFRDSLINPDLLVMLFYTTFISFTLNFTRQIALKFGPGNLWKFLTGRFHHPKEEVRIFMFLDMKDSTTHAEKLGHVKFGELIQDCFSDLTVIENRQAEVYQYVGDEAIVYWEPQKGLTDNNCVMAYFDYREQLRSRASYYQQKYDLLPVFKAGINIGEVTVTEIGDIKRDLAFLGDTMNTAARIQGQCNKYDKDLLISDNLNQQLPSSDTLKKSYLESLSLKGKQQSIGVYSVEVE